MKGGKERSPCLLLLEKHPTSAPSPGKAELIYQRREMSLEGTALRSPLLSKLALRGTIVFSLNFRDWYVQRFTWPSVSQEMCVSSLFWGPWRSVWPGSVSHLRWPCRPSFGACGMSRKPELRGLGQARSCVALSPHASHIIIR